ncbi:Fecal droplet protein [Mycena indigotica]|uniref:Fecal droplet protein n=1 Tax=Mycena indigotica TaxID=2126181 RepID=A0A8H6TFN9_9AGAR|nr:Fecal droplet protein [Mycena indigotica]KAF7316491.1 Fecal droplet protein [Mycena indigotica]
MVGHGSKHSPIYISDDESEDGAPPLVPLPPASFPPLPAPSVPPILRVQKRKREDVVDPRWPLESKKARKRRRKLEKAMARSQAYSQPPPFSLVPFLQSPAPWIPSPVDFAMQFMPSLPPFRDTVPPRMEGGHGWGPVAGPSNLHQQHSPNLPHVLPQLPILASSLPPVSPPPSPVPAPTNQPPKAPVKKPASLTIGMKPDLDKNSKHGTFIYSPVTITSITQQHATSNQYIPNPARTLVMEQLPKTHRSKDFVRTWSKGACGAHPVYFAVDPQSGKALVEFATAELARKAWSSPKISPPGQPIKGKPRADLIRAWWYRVEGVGAGVGELEEGEIEGDEEEIREASAPPQPPVPKPETKKERKARLAKERALKIAQLKAETTSPQSSVPPLPQHYDAVPYPAPTWPTDWETNPQTSSVPATRPLDPTQWTTHSTAEWSKFQSPSFVIPPPPASASNYSSKSEMDVDTDMEMDASHLESYPNDNVSRSALATANVDRGSMTPPLEPRAMKNAPKGPSFVKRSLLARQKELEERIAKGRLELEAKGIPMESVSTPPDAASMEDNLRQLVLKSQKNRLKAALPKQPVDIPPPVSSSTSSSSSHSNTPSATVSVSTFSLDAMAESFITETIQSLLPNAIVTAPPPKPMGLKEELAAKQRQLEEHIAETKSLMAQLAAAKSKQEKDRLLSIMREKSRIMDGSPTFGTLVSKTLPQSVVEPAMKLRWPDSRNDVCVLIISDDEEDDESDAESTL